MRYKVADLVKAPPGTVRWIEVDDTESAEHMGFQVVAPVQGRLRLMRDPAGILVEGRISTTLALECSRCLEAMELFLDVELSEHFRPTVAIPGGSPVFSESLEEAETITEIDARQMMDLSGVIWQNIELALPAAVLCRPDCAGICPQCGADRNHEICGCEPPTDIRWASLANLIQKG